MRGLLVIVPFLTACSAFGADPVAAVPPKDAGVVADADAPPPPGAADAGPEADAGSVVPGDDGGSLPAPRAVFEAVFPTSCDWTESADGEVDHDSRGHVAPGSCELCVAEKGGANSTAGMDSKDVKLQPSRRYSVRLWAQRLGPKPPELSVNIETKANGTPPQTKVLPLPDMQWHQLEASFEVKAAPGPDPKVRVEVSFKAESGECILIDDVQIVESAL